MLLDSPLQANHGGISVPLPRSLQDLFDEEADEDEEVEDEKDGDEEKEEGESAPTEEGEDAGAGPLDDTWGDISFNMGRGGGESLEGNVQQKQRRELQMNWHICKYLPEEGSCQSCFQVSGIFAREGTC